MHAWRDEADERHRTTRRHLDEMLAVREPTDLGPGVSVVISEERAYDDLARCLGSLARQTLDRGLFEVIVVMPSGESGTSAVLDSFGLANAAIDLRVIKLRTSGDWWARDAGIAATRRAYITFLDARDQVSASYLETMLRQASPRVVSVATVVDLEPDADHVQPMVAEHVGTLSAAEGIGAATALWGAKLAATDMVKRVAQEVDARCGDAAVFWINVALHGNLVFETCLVGDGAIYYRAPIPSRTMSFDRDVEQPLAAMASIEGLARGDDIALEFVRGPMAAQASVIGDYLRQHPGDHPRLVAELDRRPVFNLPHDMINRGMPRGLAIAYAFPPYAGTSAVVAAKRIRERGGVVDVVYNAMDRIREIDRTIRLIAGPFVCDEAVVTTPTYFSHWGSMEAFSLEGLKAVRTWESRRERYEWVYSRAHFAASHFLAAAYRLSNPSASWTAEFSDPLSRNILNQERGTLVTDGELTTYLRAGMRDLGLPVPRMRNCFVWCEEVAYALADELIFTNENQMEFMLGYCSNPEIAAVARSKAVIAPQPTLPSEFYSVVGSRYELDPDAANVAYFGNFYATRGLDDVLAAIARCDSWTRGRLRIHVFTAKPHELGRRAAELGIVESVQAGPYVRYLEFLNLTTRFDCLIVNDATTGDTHGRNPYLPSKWADYRGSGTPVWGLVERGSVLSHQPLTYMSSVGDIEAALDVLTDVVRRKVSG